jgi:predicted nucleotidyltransferase
VTIELPELAVLDDVERSALERYVRLLVDELGANLDEIAVFGSVARGERWPAGMPLRSDLDLLVVTREPLSAAAVERLVEATFPLFLESGRQLGPQFRTREQLERPETEQGRRFVENVRRDAIVLYAAASRRLRQ